MAEPNTRSSGMAIFLPTPGNLSAMGCSRAPTKDFIQFCKSPKKKVFLIGVINVMGIVQANHQMCMWQTTILIFNHVKCKLKCKLPRSVESTNVIYDTYLISYLVIST
jgi:hypothetical protein